MDLGIQTHHCQTVDQAKGNPKQQGGRGHQHNTQTSFKIHHREGEGCNN